MELERRTVLQAGGLVAVGGLVAACGSSSSSAEASAAAPAASAAASGGAAAAGSLASTADIPVGGGMIIADPAVVITQPTEGDFKCFSAICTHQGCVVGDVSNNEIICPCHGSKFSATDGSVINGPATKPLPTENISIDGTSIVLAS